MSDILEFLPVYSNIKKESKKREKLSSNKETLENEIKEISKILFYINRH